MTRCTYDTTNNAVESGVHRCPTCGCVVVSGLRHGPCQDTCCMQDADDRKVLAIADAVYREKFPEGDIG